MSCPFALTKDDIEVQFGVNHLGHFHLTNLLEDLLVKSAPSRIVIVSSAAHFIPDFHKALGGTLNFEDVKVNHSRRYSPWIAYGRSKLANVLHSNELAKRLGSKGVLVNSLHPGGVATELQRHVMGASTAALLSLPLQSLLLTPLAGALTSLYVATSPEISDSKVQARYFVPIALEHPKAEMGKDEALQKQLWEVSEKLVAEFKANKFAHTRNAGLFDEGTQGRTSMESGYHDVVKGSGRSGPAL
jgi:NAD(P)-dependent dehydrogenase (short-subunit alcohol dehydrogenase family)